jgi:hypothetical protein
MKINGLDKLQKNLKKLQETTSVPLVELLNPNFVTSHTKFSSAQEMFEASGFTINSQEDFAAIPTDKLDEFIRDNSTFPSWREMLSSANKSWLAREFGL